MRKGTEIILPRLGKIRPVVLAAVAHPDDIEFLFSGTLLLLRAAGCTIHFWNLADGSCGSLTHPQSEISRMRAQEASTSARLAGAIIHLPIFSDLAIFYDKPSLARVSAVVRSIRPQIILTHSRQDYMEDHENVSRLIATAAFSRIMRNFSTDPKRPPYPDPVRLYHAPPHGLHDGLNTPFRPDFLIDVSAVMTKKRQMLACHESQNTWLEDSQSLTAPVEEMQRLCRTMATWGNDLAYAESWQRHSHLGFCPENFDPLPELLEAVLQAPVQPIRGEAILPSSAPRDAHRS